MYRHTQIGYVTLGAAAGGGLLVGIVALSIAPSPGLWIGLSALIAVALFFSSLTTEVTQDRFVFWFGPGLIRRSFPLSEIESCTPVVNPWYYGWGIHWTRDGWLYNVSGMQALELRLRDGKKLRVGTDEPEELRRAILTMKGVA